MQKKPFLLLEILIAFLLVSVCLLPLVKHPLKLYREEMGTLEKMEMERLADWAFTEVREKLLKNEIPWKKVPDMYEKSEIFCLPSTKLEIPGYPPKVIARSFYLYGNGAKEGLDGQVYRQLSIYILLNNISYKFRLPVQKLISK